MEKIREEEEEEHHGEHHSGLEIGREKRLNAFLSFLVRAGRSNIIIRVINHQNQRERGSGLAEIKKGWNGTKQLVSTYINVRGKLGDVQVKKPGEFHSISVTPDGRRRERDSGEAEKKRATS